MTTKRAPNYSNEERALLLNIVEKYKNIVLNKKTDHSTWKQKENAWNEIAMDFNAISPAGIHRSTTSLRGYFENIKKKTRKTAADKLSLNKTGGGLSDVKNIDPTYELALSLLNTKTVCGIKNEYDCDRLIFSDDHNEIINNDVAQNESDSNIILLDDSNNDDHGPPSPMGRRLETSNSSNKNVIHNNDVVEVEKLPTKGKKQRWNKRRRATQPTSAKSELTEIYKQIGLEKLAYYKAMIEELKRKRERDEEEHELKMQILLKELESKE